MSGKQLAIKNGKLELVIRIEFCNEEVSAMDISETIKQQIAENTIILYMKGSPKLPQCGFSSQASQALMTIGEKFAYVDILANPEIRANLPKISNWPTFPQLFVKGELVGGCDIMMEMYQSGQLQALLKEATTQNS
jgi:monothiol glutaredoxin